MSRLQTVKGLISRYVEDTRKRIVESQRSGKIPGDYSLGFVNGLIFCDHHINMRDGSPNLLDRTTSVGSIPIPVTLRSGNAIKDGRTYQYLLDASLLAARNVAGSSEPLDSAEKLKALQSALEIMDRFVNEQEDFKNGS